MMVIADGAMKSALPAALHDTRHMPIIAVATCKVMTSCDMLAMKFDDGWRRFGKCLLTESVDLDMCLQLRTACIYTCRSLPQSQVWFESAR